MLGKWGSEWGSECETPQLRGILRVDIEARSAREHQQILVLVQRVVRLLAVTGRERSTRTRFVFQLLLIRALEEGPRELECLAHQLHRHSVVHYLKEPVLGACSPDDLHRIHLLLPVFIARVFDEERGEINGGNGEVSH